MEDYAGRVHCDLSQQELIIQGLKQRSDRIIVYRHDTHHPHIHFLMMGVKCKYDTLVNVVKRVIPDAKKDKYSFKTGADTKFISYMSKGKLDPVFNYGFDEDLISCMKLMGYDKDDIRVPSRSEDVVKVKSKTKTNYEIMVEIGVKFLETTGGDESYDYNVLYESTVSVLRLNKKGGDIFYVMKMMESVIMHQFPNQHRAFVQAAWASRHKINF